MCGKRSIYRQHRATARANPPDFAGAAHALLGT
jgi:hypothetical protein